MLVPEHLPRKDYADSDKNKFRIRSSQQKTDYSNNLQHVHKSRQYETVKMRSDQRAHRRTYHNNGNYKWNKIKIQALRR